MPGLRAGELYTKSGDMTSAGRVYARGAESGESGKLELAKAADVLTRVRNFEKAAELYVKSDEVAQAVLMFVRMGETERAAKLYSECQADVGFEVLSQLNPKDPSSLVIAHMFYLARDYEKAGRVFENLGEFVKASIRWKDPKRKGRPGFLDCYRDFVEGTGLIRIRAKATVKTLAKHICPTAIGFPSIVPDIHRARQFTD